MSTYRIIYRRAWRSDTGEDITPAPTLVDADWLDTAEFGVGFYRAGGVALVRSGVTVERGEVVLWVPVDLIRVIKLEEATA